MLATLVALQPALAERLGSADLDPDNDDVVAPPEPIPDCGNRLAAAGVRYRLSTVPLRQKRNGTHTCGTEQAVVYLGKKDGVRYSSPPLVTCDLALALAEFEVVLEQEARKAFGVGVRRISHGGTYSCRKMTRFSTMVSEHSYANAIDIRGFVLSDGRRVRVAADFGALQPEPTAPKPRFLRSLARRLYDERIFSVVLTPYWDALHRDHFHFDMARYRVDGTR
jgi:hypothetical protein